MTFLELIRIRQSVRKYDAGRPVAEEKIGRCLEAARLAPSACNSQPWKFIVVDEPGRVAALAAATFGKLVSFNQFTREAPLFIVIVAEPPKIVAGIGGLIKNKPYYLMDIGIAAEHFCLQAAEEGLGTCMLGWFDEAGVKKLLRIPAFKRVPLIISLGYPVTDRVLDKNRKNKEQVVSYNEY